MFLFVYLVFSNFTSLLTLSNYQIKVAGTLGRNHVKKLREERLMSKAELARIAGISPLTVNRIEKGGDCRMDTKRKIILALGLKLSEKSKVFGE
jgi:DNA-binding XRE family transcriptional regulator